MPNFSITKKTEFMSNKQKRQISRFWFQDVFRDESVKNDQDHHFFLKLWSTHNITNAINS